MADMVRPYGNWTRFLGMSPSGEIASPSGQVHPSRGDLSITQDKPAMHRWFPKMCMDEGLMRA
jgi:hypothetical protein